MGRPKRLVICIMAATVLGVGAGEMLIFLHPFGWGISAVFGIGLIVAVIVALRHVVQKQLGRNEYQTNATEVVDEMLKATDDPNEPARWVP